MSGQSLARGLLIRGMLAGLAAGLAAFVIAQLVGESSVSAAIAVEAAHSHDSMAAEHPEVFSRSVQRGIGLLTATTVYGIGLGGLFALVFAASLGRLGRFQARTLAGLLAAGGFVTLSLVPFLKYPANPPSVGEPDTIGRRTALYFTMLAISVALAVLAVSVGRWLAPRLGSWNATIAAGALFTILVGLCQWALPGVNEVGRDFPAGTPYQFRLASLGVQVSVWTTLGLTFGALAERLVTPRRSASAAAEPVPV